ncbi:unnamed protein product [Pseudo-nitzschia multistriata]|uniref:Uncharacterized protein n=1 Tax=Pseudo-nitzschia multistriata TaxID=183589 RepID=A0A448Z6V3_9STRA|nr:unnamed protein product [Pseudo-nitzschia multistriata]
MSRISRNIFAFAVIFASSVQKDAAAFSPTVTSTLSSKPSIPAKSSAQRAVSSSLAVSNSINLCDDRDYVQILEDKLIHFSKIDDDDVRRNDFEAFVTGRLQEELAFTNAAAKSTVERLKLKSLDFVKAMDKTILKLGQSAQDQGWESHVTSGFQPVPKGGNDIWPYVDMLIQFKLLISNMERMSHKKPIAAKSNGCKCTGCPGLNSCKDGKNKKEMPNL